MGCELSKLARDPPGADLLDRPPPPGDPRIPLTPKQQYCMLASWKGISRAIEHTGVVLFIRRPAVIMHSRHGRPVTCTRARVPDERRRCISRPASHTYAVVVEVEDHSLPSSSYLLSHAYIVACVTPTRSAIREIVKPVEYRAAMTAAHLEDELVAASTALSTVRQLRLALNLSILLIGTREQTLRQENMPSLQSRYAYRKRKFVDWNRRLENRLANMMSRNLIMIVVWLGYQEYCSLYNAELGLRFSVNSPPIQYNAENSPAV
ncbi:hypothetical protein EVAR_35988_1 [Eumeta japonica]|uniref:Uncharacterized protein n=1 Tax=Eumeta variegata TaxID=151549 RepID=A0A4C1WT30_EUMVA|nr:hypothetical protein EVAR_35988_1 [Eumeta japonica]